MIRCKDNMGRATFLSPQQEDHPEPFSQGRPRLMKIVPSVSEISVPTSFAGL